MTSLLQAAKQALEALEQVKTDAERYEQETGKSIVGWMEPVKIAYVTLRQAIAQAEQQESAIDLDKLHEMNMQYVYCPACGSDMAQAYSPKAEQQVTRADLKAAFKEGFERAADLYAPKDVQEPYAYEVWDVQDQSFTMIYATQLKEFHWIEPENIARVLYAAPVRTKDLTDDELRQVLDKHCGDGLMAIAYAVIATDREKNRG